MEKISTILQKQATFVKGGREDGEGRGNFSTRRVMHSQHTEASHPQAEPQHEIDRETSSEETYTVPSEMGGLADLNTYELTAVKIVQDGHDNVSRKIRR